MKASIPKKRILFVDDEPEQVKYYVIALESAGCEVRLIPSSTLAAEFCLKNFGAPATDPFVPDLLILDMMMPVPEKVHAPKVDGGLATGAYLLAEHRRHNGHVPGMILSNLNERESVEVLCRICKDLLPALPNGTATTELLGLLRRHLRVVVHEKRRTPPFLLPGLVSRIVEQ